MVDALCRHVKEHGPCHDQPPFCPITANFVAGLELALIPCTADGSKIKYPGPTPEFLIQLPAQAIAYRFDTCRTASDGLDDVDMETLVCYT
eukprot:5578373-Karenia_brevis.AAC.1